MKSKSPVSAGGSVSDEAGGQVKLEDAFAFILPLNREIALETLASVERCRVVASFDELCACTDGAGPDILSKPVVILSGKVPPGQNHLVDAVTAHWRHGEKYVISRVKCSYLPATGDIELERVTKPEIARLALLRGVLTMPLREALLPHARLPVFVPSDQFTVCVPDVAPSDEEMTRLESVFKAQLQTPTEYERLAKTGALNQAILSQLDIGAHFPVADLIEARLADHRRLNVALASKEFSGSAIEDTISLIGKSADDLIYMPEKLGDFLLALSERGGTLLSLEVATLQTYIALSRQSCRADEVAANLSRIAADLCRLDQLLVAPLFEFLAACLSSKALNAVYRSVIPEFLGAHEPCIRLAQSMRRFGDEDSLAFLLLSLHRAQPRWLEKTSLKRCFQPLLKSRSAPALASQLGEKTLASMEAVVDVTDQFRSAVLAGDRLLALETLRQGEFQRVDFERWLNGLRGLSNELRQLALPISELQMPDSQTFPGRRLAAIIFGDQLAIEAMRGAGELGKRDDLNAVAFNIIGENALLNDRIQEKFAKSLFIPMRVEGNCPIEVFRNAAELVAGSDEVDGPLVSVIMSAYNPDLDLMKLSLDSIAAQTWKNVELFIVDDASDRASEIAIAQLANTYNHVRVIRVEENSGPYLGRNLALLQAKGEFIAIQDADDWSHPQRIAAQVAYLLQTPEARAVTTEHIRINRSGKVALEGHFQAFGHGPMTSMFRAELFEHVGGFATIRSRGDLEMYQRVAAYYGGQANAFLPLPMALCLADSKTLSHNTAAQRSHHLQLLRTNLYRRTAMTSLFRDGVRLRGAHQVPIPMMLRAPQDSQLHRPDSELGTVDPTTCWQRLDEDLTTLGNQRGGDQTRCDAFSRIDADVIAAQTIAGRYLELETELARDARSTPLKVDRESLLAGICRTYENMGIRQALARVFIHAGTADERSRAIEALARRMEADDRQAATCLYQLAYDQDPSSAKARKLAAKMFQNGDLDNASRLLKLTSHADGSSSVIANLRLADALRSGVTIPPRKLRHEVAEVDVAYVAAGTLPFLNSGYAVRTHQMLRAPRQQGVSTVCHARPGFPFDRLDALDLQAFDAGKLAFDGVDYCYSSVAPILDDPTSYIERLSRALEEEFASSRPAVVQAASNYMNSLPALIAARRAGLPFIYEVRGLWELSVAARLSGWEDTDRFKLDREMEALVAREADHVLTITQGVADELVAGGVPAAKISLLPNAVDPELFHPGIRDAQLAAELGITGGFTLVYAGSINAYEGLDDLITAIAQLRQQGVNVRLVIVGDGAAMLPLKKQVAESGLRAVVTFVGRVPPDEVLSYLSLADAVTIPRKPFKVCNLVSPLKPLEAMALGKPVVATDLPALREIVQDGVTGLLVAPEQPPGLACALDRLASDPDLRLRLGDAGRRWVLQKRSWSANAQFLKQLYAVNF